MTDPGAPHGAPVRRARRTKAELFALHADIYATAAELQPLTLRGLFYALTVRGAVPKTELGYEAVLRETAKLRRAGTLPYRWFTDGTRLMRKPRSWDRLEDWAEASREMYRRALWADQAAYVEVWCEKDALSSVLYPVTAEWDVPLMVTRGNSSLTFLHDAAETIVAVGKPTVLYLLTDYDPGGTRIWRQVVDTLTDFVGGIHAETGAATPPVRFVSLAVNEDQILELDLPTRPTKATDVHAARHGPTSVELDAIPAPTLRTIVAAAIEAHIDPEVLAQHERIEAAERESLERLSWPTPRKPRKPRKQS